MKLKIKYRAVHVDNYQGGSGSSFENEVFLQVEENLSTSEIIKQCTSTVTDKRTHYQDDNLTLLSIEIIDFKFMEEVK